MFCTIVTPEKTALDEEADFVALTLYDGEIGIGANHSPMIGRLGYGEMRLRRGDVTQRFYIDGGFAQVTDGRVTVLTSRAVPADQIDTKAAEKQLATALKEPGNSREKLEIRDRLVQRARGMLRVAGK